MTIREPSSTLRADAPPAPSGKGKKKVSEPLTPIDKSLDENGIVFSFLDSLPIPCHLFDEDENFKYAIGSLNSNFFEAESECSSSTINNVSTSNSSLGILLRIFLALISLLF